MTAPQDDIPMPARAKVEAALATIDDDRTTADWNEIEEAARWALRVTPPERPVTDVRSEIIRLMREDFDPTPPNWEDRDWYDNADDVADKIIALFGSERPTQVSDEPCGVCGGSGNIFSQKFDREGNERVLRCPCKDGGFSINEADRLYQENGALRRLLLCVREYQDLLRRSTNVGPVTKGPHKEARLLRAMYEAAANAHAILEGRPDQDCQVCGGDCASANPPVSNCPRQSHD